MPRNDHGGGCPQDGTVDGFVPPVAVLCKALGIKELPTEPGGLLVSARALREVISLIVRNIHVDDSWYKETYPDVAAAIMAGDIMSCREHFLRAGYFEGRLPSEPPFDEAWYLRSNPDIAAAHSAGEVASARLHFLYGGQQEGRAGIPEHETAAQKWVAMAETTADLTG